MSGLAPVVLFVYNRPEHARKTVAALQANRLADQTDLIIVSDAPKSPQDASKVAEVRQFIRGIEGFALVEIVEHKTNLGLAASIAEGVTGVIARYGKVIVLEDDLVTSPGFLAFMNGALDHYADDERVMSVNAYVLPGIQASAGQAFFIRCPTSWGWATWQRSWVFYQRDPEALVKTLTPLQRHQFDFDSTFPYFRTIVRNWRGEIRTWAIFWYAAVFLHQGLCVSPPVSLVNNIGNDGSGTHARAIRAFDGGLGDGEKIVFPMIVKEDQSVVEQYKAFYRRHHPDLLTVVYMALLVCVRHIQILCSRGRSGL